MKQQPLAAEAVASLLQIDESTLERLRIYVQVLRRWQPAINLVSTGTLADIWRRHILDCAQLLPLLPTERSSIIDLGSGAGLPGLILAMLSSAPVTLVESDARKCAFLREAARLTATPVTIANRRIENLAPTLQADVIVARALAPLPALLRCAAPLLAPGGRCLLLKGRSFADELTSIEKTPRMHVTVHPSLSDPEGVVLQVEFSVADHDR